MMEHDKYCEYKLMMCNNCEKHFKRVDLQNHDTKKCLKAFNCKYSFNGCPTVVTKLDYENHQNECDYVEITCEICGTKVNKYFLIEHLNGVSLFSFF